MTDIYLIRHAEAEGNLYRRAQGQYDSALTLLGQRQTAALAQRFRSVPLDAIWASDLIRTRSTASGLMRYHPTLPLYTDPALREVDVGVWEDRPWGNIRAEDPEQMERFEHDPARWSVPGSEDCAALAARMERSLLALAQAHPGGAVAAVSHAYAIRVLACSLTGGTFDQIPYGSNTAVTHLRAQDGRLSLVSYGDSSHLGEELRRPAGRVDGLFQPFRFPSEERLYEHCYRETWRASHGDLRGYAPVLYIQAARQHLRADSQCLVKICCGGAMAGVVELDPERGREEQAGWISLLYVAEPFRRRRLGAQLIGHAVSWSRRHGRQVLRLHVSGSNTAAQAFYRSLGFVSVSALQGVGGPLLLMEMPLVPRVWRLP